MIPATSFPDDSAESLPADKEFERDTLKKFDYKTLTMILVFYFVATGNLRIVALQDHIALPNRQFQICLTVFFAFCIPTAIPANLLLRKIGARTLMSTFMVLWGIVASLQVLGTSYKGSVTVAAFLGFLEGPVRPTAILYLSRFHTRQELSLRLAVVLLTVPLSNAITAVLLSPLQNSNVDGGKDGWPWILVSQGLFAFVMGILGFFLIPATPRACKVLTEDEKCLIERRLRKDRPSSCQIDESPLKQIICSLTSPHVVLVFIMMFMLGTLYYDLQSFPYGIVALLGFDPTKSQLLILAPSAVGFVVACFFAYLSDKYRNRAIPVALLGAISTLGYGIHVFTTKKYVAYASLYLIVPGVFAGGPILLSWMANNSDPYYREGTSIAIGITAMHLGGILSSWGFPLQEAPRYRRTAIVDLAFCGTIVFAALVNSLLLSHMNVSKKFHRNEILAPYTDEKNPDGGEKAWRELGDTHPDFRYIL
ncbi:hypothetical protein BS47DRAFT_1288246 [Hydnum rufescens UP504]|uniref:MFS transporter n=1 Tax=Hydnum rufescens UP504 TaxID=1448309 RepID=A0A9P6BB09_9AGAM|nr:hypothetical protein BS47DRAFT_1288246 [Hydnum rufescens UP504]